MSLNAAGSLGGTLINQSWKGRSYMRKLTKPANPKSEKQISFRAMFAYLTKHWASIGAVGQATWDVPAAIDNILPFNAFLQTNMLRYALEQAPGETFPVGETGAGPTTLGNAANLQGRGLLVEFSITILRNGQGAILHTGATSGFTPTLDNVLAVVPTPFPGTFTFFHQPLAPGTYWYRWHHFTLDGLFLAIDTQFSGIVP